MGTRHSPSGARQILAIALAVLMVSSVAGAALTSATTTDKAAIETNDGPVEPWSALGLFEGASTNDDDVPERWVLGDHTIDEDTVFAERLRVLPGGNLTIRDATVAFETRTEGPTGIVVEPGGRLVIEDAVLEQGPSHESGDLPVTTSARDEHGYIVHLEGEVRIEQTRIEGTERVVAQPRSLTDHVDDSIGHEIEGQVPEWDLVRQETNGSTVLANVEITATGGPGLVAGVPQQTQTPQPDDRAPVHGSQVSVTTPEGPAIACYETEQQNDPNTDVQPLYTDKPTRLPFQAVDLQAGAGPAVYCPPDPTAFEAPSRNAPTVATPAANLTPGELSQVNQLIPPSPAPEAKAGPNTVTLDGGEIGPGPLGLLVRVGQDVNVQGVTFADVDRGVHLDATDGTVSISDVDGTGLGSLAHVAEGSLTVDGAEITGTGAAGVRTTGGTVELVDTHLGGFESGLDVSGGTVTVTDGHLEGAHAGQGLAIAGGQVALDGTRVTAYPVGAHQKGGDLETNGARFEGTGTGVGLDLDAGTSEIAQGSVRGFAVGIDDEHGATIQSVDVSAGQVCLASAGPVDVTFSDLASCRRGLVLEATTGARVVGNDFVDTDEPLLVESPDPAANRAHFDHAVRSNRVDGQPLVYLFEASDVEENGVGHAIVAFSQNVRVTDLDLSAGSYQVVASDEVVVDTLTDQQTRLLTGEDPALGLSFQQVRRQVRMDFYEGSMKGPEGAWNQKFANDIDQAALLADRFEALGYEARLVEGDMDAPVGALLNWTGTETFEAAQRIVGLSDALNSHFWVEVQTQDGVWLEVDPSYVMYDWVKPQVFPNGAFDTGVDQMLANLTESGGVIERVDGFDAGENPIVGQSLNASEIYRDAVENRTLTPTEIRGGLSPRATQPSEEPDRTPMRRVEQVPDAQEWTASVSFGGETWTNATPDVYNEAITILSGPATPQDHEALYENGGLFNTSRDDVKLNSTLYVDGTFAFEDETPRAPSEDFDVNVKLRAPDGDVIVDKTSTVRAGGAYGIVLDLGRTSRKCVLDAYDRWFEAGQRLENFTDAMGTNETYEGPGFVELLGNYFRAQGCYYFSQVHSTTETLARDREVVHQRLGGVAFTGMHALPTITDDGTPSTNASTSYFDVRSTQSSVARDADPETRRMYNLASGAIGSEMEGDVFEYLYAINGTSTTNAFAQAMDEGQPLYALNASNVDRLLPKTDLPSVADQQIRNAISNGKVVIVHEASITVGQWSGAGWAEIDPQTGLAAWMIAGRSEPTGANVTGDTTWAIEGGQAGSNDGLDCGQGTTGRLKDSASDTFEGDLTDPVKASTKGTSAASLPWRASNEGARNLRNSASFTYSWRAEKALHSGDLSNSRVASRAASVNDAVKGAGRAAGTIGDVYEGARAAYDASQAMMGEGSLEERSAKAGIHLGAGALNIGAGYLLGAGALALCVSLIGCVAGAALAIGGGMAAGSVIEAGKRSALCHVD